MKFERMGLYSSKRLQAGGIKPCQVYSLRIPYWGFPVLGGGIVGVVGCGSSRIGNSTLAYVQRGIMGLFNIIQII